MQINVKIKKRLGSKLGKKSKRLNRNNNFEMDYIKLK